MLFSHSPCYCHFGAQPSFRGILRGPLPPNAKLTPQIRHNKALFRVHVVGVNSTLFVEILHFQSSRRDEYQVVF